MKYMTVFRFLCDGALLAFAAGCAGAQTQVDLRTQSKDVDFSAAASTKPFQTGTVLPRTCSLGQIFFKSDATPGQNIYGCAATNTWTQERTGDAPEEDAGNAQAPKGRGFMNHRDGMAAGLAVITAGLVELLKLLKRRNKQTDKGKSRFKVRIEAEYESSNDEPPKPMLDQ